MSATRDDTFTHICPIAGGELRLSVDGERVGIAIHMRGARVPLTASLNPEEAERAFTRGLEMVPHAKAYRQQRRGL